MLEWFLLGFFFFLGLAVGSYLNVLVFRFGFEERGSVRSECAQCGTRIPWYDLVPVVSFVTLRGRCRFCGSALSMQYPLVELATGILFALAYFFRPPVLAVLPLVSFFSLLTFTAVAIAVVAYDIRHTLIPLPFVYALLASAAVSRAAEALLVSNWQVLYDGMLGMFFLAGFFALIVLVSRERGMGAGDVYVAGAIGLLLGALQGIAAVVIGVWIATAFYLLLMLLARAELFAGGRHVTMKTELPFAPWLLLGTAFAFFADISVLSMSDWFDRFLFWQ